jgi:hypothetical protein
MPMFAARTEAPPQEHPRRLRERGQPRLLASAALVVALLVSACASDAPTYTVPPLRPTPSPLALVDPLAALQNRAGFVLDGTVQPHPLFIDWDSIEQGKQLANGKASALCRALELPKADDVLASIALLALNAASERFRHKPAITDPDTEALFKTAVGWVNKTCAAWEPHLVTLIASPRPTSTPTAADPGDVAGDPDLSWYFDAPGSMNDCQHPACWRIEVSSRGGCPTKLAITMTITDRGSGVVAGTAPFESTDPWPSGVSEPFDIWWDGSRDVLGRVTSISCE